MQPREYLQSKLDELKRPAEIRKPATQEELIDTIYKLTMSKNFRKYSVSDEHAQNILSAVTICVKENRPLQTTIVFGGYKLWRLEETPEVDWAELFTMMYYTNWMKPICAIYEPGVWFDFFSDDVIVPFMNNVPAEDTQAYQDSFKKLLEFLKPYQPENLNMTYNRVGDQYESIDEFKKDWHEQMGKIKDALPEISESLSATLSLNVKTTEEQRANPNWQKEVQLMHDGFGAVTKRRPYYNTPDKIQVFSTPNSHKLAVGSTKDSVMKFWIGTGVLKTKDDSYRQIVMSPGQLKDTEYQWQDLNIPSLSGKNFKKIRVLKS